MKLQFERKIVSEVIDNLKKEIPLLHIIVGPRQVGKTIAAEQIMGKWEGESFYAVADLPLPPKAEWIIAQWETAKLKAKKGKKVLLVFDELQKVAGWSEVLKKLYDEEKRKKEGISVLVLGSSALLLVKGLAESLSGRFYKYNATHWNYYEMQKAFGWDLNKWFFFGGYPGASQFSDNYLMWSRYVNDSLIETVLARDVLQLQTVTKPALLRNLFGLSSMYPAQILSYNKMLGQLQDAGNTTTLANYLKLLETAFLVSGLEQFRQGKKVHKGSSPKLIVWNNALINSLIGRQFEDVINDRTYWGRIVENAVIAHLLNNLNNPLVSISYWRDGDYEVDLVVKTPKKLWAVEIKSGRIGKLNGLNTFLKEYPKAQPLIIGEGGLSMEEYFIADPLKIFL